MSEQSEREARWAGCSRDEAIRQAEQFHAGQLRWMDEHDKRRAERDAALEKLRAVEALADEWQAACEHGGNGRLGLRANEYGDVFADDLRAALARAEVQP